jgi:hypothetical protein
MTSPWWAALGPTETTVSCGGGQHLVRWADDRLVPADHPDAEGELVLAALGGDATPCLDLVQSWGAHSDDLAVLAIGPRSASDTLTVTPTVLGEIDGNQLIAFAPSGPISIRRARRVVAWTGSRPVPSPIAAALRRQGGGFSRGHAGIGFHAPHGRRGHPFRLAGGDDEPKRIPLLKLLALGAPFQWRLSGAVAYAWSAEGPRGSNLGRVRPALTAALAGRVAPAAARWLGIGPEQVEVSLHDQDGWGEVSVGAQGVRTRLPVSWMARVWAPGLALVDGHLVVSVEDADWPQARVLALGPGRKPVELTVRSDGRNWSVAK